MKEIVDYIRNFLAFGDAELAGQIGYTADKAMWEKYRVIIIPGDNVLSKGQGGWAEPDLTATPEVEKRGDVSVIKDDIIYNTLFCISLAGEHLECRMDSPRRDEHGRIPSVGSPLGRQGLQMRPVIDEYSSLVMSLLGAELPAPGFSRIALTHDVDSICRYRHLRGFLGGIRRGKIMDAFKSLADINRDPIYTFEWMHSQDCKVDGAEEIYFFKAGKGRGLDYPQYHLAGSDFRKLKLYLKSVGAKIGLHGSYESAETLKYRTEKSRLENILDGTVHLHRNHYLRLLSYEQLQCLADAGFTADYTVGWADHIGFRLGTTRPVRWINPMTLRLTELTLHPLCIMDCTLSERRYMDISDEEQVMHLCVELFDTIRKYQGELTLLWHNSIFAESEFHRSIYQDITDYLSSSPESRWQLIRLGTGEKLDYDRSETFVDQFLRSVYRWPDAVAVVDKDSQMTYRELDERSNALAHWLINEKRVNPNDFVAIEMPRVKEFVVAVLGIWKAGAAYVPLDPSLPRQRISFIIGDCKSKVVITPDTLHEINNAYISPINTSDPTGPAYVIYTSGSTGQPKGTVIGHKAFTSFTVWSNQYLNHREGSRHLVHASFSFDISIIELLCPLAVGGEVHILSEEARMDIKAIAGYINEKGIDGATFPTSVGMLLLNSCDVNLEYAVLAGEKMYPVRKSGTNVVNVYGPSEFCIGATFYEVRGTESEIPIGRPVPNCRAKICDAEGQLTPRGQIGELYLSGVQLGLGYINGAELNKEKYIDGWYRTGDLCRWNEEGNLEYIGRVDSQVKLRGFRIELGEVESALLKIEGITSAVVEVKNFNGSDRLCGYYISDEPMDENTLKDALSRTLPDYMIPEALVHLDSLPLTPNGKIDRRSLPTPEPKAVNEFVPPHTLLEKSICTAYCQVLNVDSVSIDDDFFLMGGDSLKVLRLQILCKDIGLSARDVFRLRTPRLIAGFLEEGHTENVPLEIPPSVPLNMTQRGIFVECMKKRGEPIYHIAKLFRLSEDIDICRLCKALKTSVSAHPGLFAEIFVDSDGVLSQKQGDMADVSIEIEEMSEEHFNESKDNFVEYYSLLNTRLFKIRVIRTPSAHYLFYDFHHIIFDGESMNILLHDVESAYKGDMIYSETFTSFHYALLEQERRKSQYMEECRQWFLDTFARAGQTSLPECDLTQVENEEDTVCCSSLTTPTGLLKEELSECAHRFGVTENILAITAFGKMLGGLSGTNKAVFTTIHNGRNDFRTSSTVSMTVRMMPVFMEWTVSDDAGKIMMAEKDQMTGCIAHDIFSFAELCAQTAFDSRVSFVYQSNPEWRGKLCGVPCQEIPLTGFTAKEPLMVHLLNEADGLYLRAEYRSDLFSERRIKEILEHYICQLKLYLDYND